MEEADTLLAQQWQQQQHASSAFVAVARMLSAGQQWLVASPECWHTLRVVLDVVRCLWVVLLLEAVLHGSLGFMLASAVGLTATTMLRRLLVVLRHPVLCASLTNAAELQHQLRLLLPCMFSTLPQPHSKLLLAFDSQPLEDQYKRVGVCACGHQHLSIDPALFCVSCQQLAQPQCCAAGVPA